MTGVVALLVAGIVALSPPLVAGEAHAHRGSAPGTKLGDGFVVAEGTRLVGAVFPDFTADWSDRAQPTLQLDGWLALLTIDGNVAGAIDRYRRQASAAGYHETQPLHGGGSAEPCDHRDHGEICTVAFRRANTLVQLRTRTCADCRQPVTAATIVSTRLTPENAAALPDSIPAAPVTPGTNLSPGEIAAARRMPVAGEQLFPDRMFADSPYPGKAVVGDSTVLGRAQYLDVCERDFIAVARVDEQPRRVFDAYTRRFVGDAPPMSMRTKFRTADVLVASNGSWTTTMIDPRGARAPLLSIDWCG